MVSESRLNLKQLGISYPDFQDWQRDARFFEEMYDSGYACCWRYPAMCSRTATTIAVVLRSSADEP